MNEVGLQISSGLNKPIYVLDYSKPIIEEIIEEVEKLPEGAIIISERFNPFFKKTFYKIKRTAITGFKVVGCYFDYRIATQSARRYAKENNLKYIN